MRNSQVIVLSGDNSATITGSAYDVGQIISASFQVVNGDVSAEGTVKLQASNDPVVGPRSNFTPTNWSDIPTATSTVASGVGPMIVLEVMNFSFIRAVYTRSSGGSTTLKLQMNALGQ